jgi:hypothetical protein
VLFVGSGSSNAIVLMVSSARPSGKIGLILVSPTIHVFSGSASIPVLMGPEEGDVMKEKHCRVSTFAFFELEVIYEVLCPMYAHASYSL